MSENVPKSGLQPPKKPRKIIRITEVDSWPCALCDDGTVWMLTHQEQWKKLPSIPQG